MGAKVGVKVVSRWCQCQIKVSIQNEFARIDTRPLSWTNRLKIYEIPGKGAKAGANRQHGIGTIFIM